MYASSATSGARLSEEQQSYLTAYRDYWTQVRNSTTPASRSVAERGVALAYVAAGLAPPQQIVWCDSPVGIEKSRKASWYEVDAGRNFKEAIVDDVIRRVSIKIAERVPVRIRMSALNGIELEPRFISASNELNAGLNDEISRVPWRAGARRKALMLRLMRKPWSPYTAFNASRWLQHESVGLLAVYAYLHNVCGFVQETSPLQGIWQIITNAGGIVPHERTCWISDRHITLSIDPNGRLHNANGPAVAYRDGIKIYSWKGVRVPAWLIESPEQIDASLIDREGNPIIRQCMIDIMTPERYIETGIPVRFAVDKVGTLWRKQWLDWRDAWSAVEVVNGTPEADGSLKHYFLTVPPEIRTPTEAVAWTYGMTAQRYSALKLRT